MILITGGKPFPDFLFHIRRVTKARTATKGVGFGVEALVEMFCFI